MKIRIFMSLLATTVLFWSCDEPQPITDSSFVYNPFAFKQDTLNTVSSITSGTSDIAWGDHLGGWVGFNEFYKAGVSMDFTFPDTLFDSTLVDSVRIEMRHVLSFPAMGTDTTVYFNMFETTGMTPDISTESYGDPLGSDTVLIDGGNDYWSFKLPSELFLQGDSAISLGIFPGVDSVLSLIHGSGSSLRPALTFYSHEADTVDSAGNAIITQLYHGIADTVYMHLMETPNIFDREQYAYLHQLSQDSIIFTLDIESIVPEGDTLIHISSASFFPAVDTLASRLYYATEDDTLRSFYLSVTDPISEITIDVQLGESGSYLSNEINTLIQAALDDERTIIDLVLRPNHIGYDPGFIAISKLNEETEIQIYSSMAVRP